MAKRQKTRLDLEGLLADLSEPMFPDQFGQASVGLDTRTADGDTPLHTVIRQCNIHGTKLLIEAGADLNAAGNMGETPLHAAVFERNEKMLRLLIEAGADMTVLSDRKQTPLEMAREHCPDFVRVFRSAGH